jgi:hypothetical protein
MLVEKSPGIDVFARPSYIEVGKNVGAAAQEMWKRIKAKLEAEQGYRNGMTHLLGIDLEPDEVSALVDIPLFRSGVSEVVTNVQHLAESDPISQIADIVEIAWRHYLAFETPNGGLFFDNALYRTLIAGHPMVLIHVTPAFNRIMKSGVIKPSGGCLGASIYTAPLTPDGRLHNLTRFVKQEQIEGNIFFPKKTDLLLIEFPAQEFRPNLLSGVDYLKYGPMQWETFKLFHQERRISHEVAMEITDHFKNQLTPEVVNFLRLCSRHRQIGLVPTSEFEEAFRIAQADFKYLGYPLFEAMTEYICMYQNDEESRRLKDAGELNTHNYFTLAFAVRPELYKGFNLKWFNPSFTDMAEKIEWMAKKGRGILNFDRNHFFEFLKWRTTQHIRKSMGLVSEGQVLTTPPLTNIEELVAFGDKFPGLAGHITRCALRADPARECDHHYYEQIRAQKIWENWNETNTVFVMNSILPKGEVGFNLTTNVPYKMYKGEVTPEGRVVKSSNHLDLCIPASIIRASESALRPRAGV